MIRTILKTLYWNQWLGLALFFFIGDFVCHWVLDIAIHDAYLVIGDYQIGLFVGSFFLITWSLFRFFPAFKSMLWLARIHVTGTTIVTIVIFILLNNEIHEQKLRRYSDYSVYTEFNQPQSSNEDWILLLLYVFLILQLSWFVQLIVWYYYKVRKV
ncbi:MAG: hypothetical protein QE487_12510 [Fluviicola sp.]|nr:hypothetical protein [Fluviicola sp.]